MSVLTSVPSWFWRFWVILPLLGRLQLLLTRVTGLGVLTTLLLSDWLLLLLLTVRGDEDAQLSARPCKLQRIKDK